MDQTLQVADDLKHRLCEAFSWDVGKDGEYADPSGWWRDPTLLGDTAAALAALHGGDRPTVVAAVEATGFILGAAVALHLGVGFVDIRKDKRRALEPHESLLRSRTPPDYDQRDLVLTLRRSRIQPSDRVLVVDDWMATGAQATAVRDLVELAKGQWIGVALVVEDVPAEVRRRLNVRSLLRKPVLPWWHA
ncbi:MAG: adenine phosphoribosyltransferase [Acidimicrobiales bacterium]|jgi:adenine phosphoribosyltransferase|nr:adenine phosphoribosyltransferase [Acidimicrobiales bacterium]